jgi:hypothetical protein
MKEGDVKEGCMNDGLSVFQCCFRVYVYSCRRFHGWEGKPCRFLDPSIAGKVLTELWEAEA